MHETGYRTHTCGELRASDVGAEVTLAGWAHRCRDQGGLVFIDLRDRYGIIQIGVSQAEQREAHAVASDVRAEFALQVKGTVCARPQDAINEKLPTGTIEIAAAEIRVLSTSPTPPFDIAAAGDVSDEVRLKYRPLDLRRPEVQGKLLRRHEMNRVIRDFFDKRGFAEIETPVLVRATPEGARDYLVPSRVHRGKFYALPQSPQIYKQILMCAGFDRYSLRRAHPCSRSWCPAYCSPFSWR